MNPFFMQQIDKGNGGTFIPPENPFLIVLLGESNSGGIAPNLSATNIELSKRNLAILNNNTLKFENLKIGTNNLIGHVGLEYAMFNSHGMELELANQYDSGFFNDKKVFLVKAGAGGSKVSEWNPSGQYFNTFLNRVNKARNLLKVSDENIIFMLSLGINDKGINTPVSTYKNGLKTLIQNMKLSLGLSEIKLSIMDFQFVTNLSISDFNTAISEVATEENVQTFSTFGLTTIPDGYHLDYVGMKTATNNFLNNI